MKHEHEENKKVRDYLNLSFKVADAFINMAWTDVDTDKIKQEVEERKYV